MVLGVPIFKHFRVACFGKSVKVNVKLLFDKNLTSFTWLLGRGFI